MVPKLTALLSRFLDATDPERDLKLLAFGAVVVFSILWLTREQARGPITPQWVDAFKWLLLATSLGGAAWTLADKMTKGKMDAAEPSKTPEPGKEGQEG